MSRSENVPAEADTLCEGCGYVLNGLPAGTRCPECGKPTDESAATLRMPLGWESGQKRQVAAFRQATLDCIFSPVKFFRMMDVRPAGPRSLFFARIHWIVAALLLGSCAWLHAGLMGGLGPMQVVTPSIEKKLFLASILLFLFLTYAFLYILNSIAASLTTFEATYRGIRLPRPVVLRALHYHAAHYLPVGLLAMATVGGFKLALIVAPRYVGPYEVPYLYIISAEVIVAAGYLFKTYWIAMRNLMYANRPAASVHQNAL